jgi:ribonuclease P protein component
VLCESRRCQATLEGSARGVFSHETHLPTFGGSPQTHARFSRTHEDPGRARCHSCSPRQGTSASSGLISCIRSAKDFSALLGSRHRRREGAFALHALPSEGLQPRLGLIVPKKLVKSAVRRNTIKRWSRVLMRAHVNDHCDVLVRVHSKVSMTSALERRQHWQLLKALFMALMPARTS